MLGSIWPSPIIVERKKEKPTCHIGLSGPSVLDPMCRHDFRLGQSAGIKTRSMRHVQAAATRSARVRCAARSPWQPGLPVPALSHKPRSRSATEQKLENSLDPSRAGDWDSLKRRSLSRQPGPGTVATLGRSNRKLLKSSKKHVYGFVLHPVLCH